MKRSRSWWLVAVAGAALIGTSAWAFAADAPAAAKKAPAKKSKAAGVRGNNAALATLKETITGPEVRNFRAFCDEWMQKLRDRETYNTGHITWETRDGKVSGEHVAYGTDSSCIAREDPGKVPIGKITYREIRYRREGATPTAALAAPGTIVEQSDVTEIFRFGKGRWQY
jgi:hypothetical protein